MLILGSLCCFSRFPKEFIGLIDSSQTLGVALCGRVFDDPLRFQRGHFCRRSHLLRLLSLLAAVWVLASPNFASLWLDFSRCCEGSTYYCFLRHVEWYLFEQFSTLIRRLSSGRLLFSGGDATCNSFGFYGLIRLVEV